ncbi:MAG: hypothetical protein ACFHWZ_00940 [Phycisphaerales bacterium]
MTTLNAMQAMSCWVVSFTDERGCQVAGSREVPGRRISPTDAAPITLGIAKTSQATQPKSRVR